jgi:thiol-disulfide isomerase/thioredoxin
MSAGVKWRPITVMTSSGMVSSTNALPSTVALFMSSNIAILARFIIPRIICIWCVKTELRRFLRPFKMPIDLMHFSGVCIFTADWCGPCKKVKPFICEELKNIAGEEEWENFFLPINVDSDDAKSLTEQYKVRSIPVVMFFVDGEAIANATFVGADQSKVTSGINQLSARGVFEKKEENQNGLPVCTYASVECQPTK